MIMLFEYQIFFICVLFMFFIGCIYGFTKVLYKASKTDEEITKDILREAIRKKIRIIISDPKKFETEFHMFEVFKEYYIDSIFNEILKNVEEKGLEEYLNCNKHLTIDKNKFSKLLMNELTNQTTTNFFHQCYANWIKNNIEEAERLENDAIKYHNSFGEEPDGDPILHPKILESDTTEKTKNEDIEINDLLNTGTIEDIENE